MQGSILRKAFIPFLETCWTATAKFSQNTPNFWIRTMPADDFKHNARSYAGVWWPEPLLLTWFNFNPSMVKHKVWNEITYPFPNFNNASNFIPYWAFDYQCIVKRVPGISPEYFRDWHSKDSAHYFIRVCGQRTVIRYILKQCFINIFQYILSSTCETFLTNLNT